MTERYSDMADTQYAQQKLKTLKQAPGEAVQSYAERIRDMVEDAYGVENLADDTVQKFLKDIF